MERRLSRPISRTSSKPSVVKMLIRAPARCTTTLVAIVVPMTIRSIRPGSISTSPTILRTPEMMLSVMFSWLVITFEK